MKYLFIGDIHGNISALNSIIEFASENKIDIIVCTGDLVGYLPFSNDVINKFKQNNIITISGNHDAYLTGKLIVDPKRSYYRVFEEDKRRITPENLAWLASKDPYSDFEIDIHKAIALHGGFIDPYMEYLYPEKLQKEYFDHIEYSLVVIGHSHLQFVLKIGEKLVLNPGSVGLPRNGDFRVHSISFDTHTMLFTQHRIIYNVNEILDLALKSNSVNDKILHNLNFGRSSLRTLKGGDTHFCLRDRIRTMYPDISIITTRFGMILSNDAFYDASNLLYIALYEDNTVELTSSTLVFNWQANSNMDFLLKDCMRYISKDAAGFYYLHTYDRIEELENNLEDELRNSFDIINKFKINNVKI